MKALAQEMLQKNKLLYFATIMLTIEEKIFFKTNYYSLYTI